MWAGRKLGRVVEIRAIKDCRRIRRQAKADKDRAPVVAELRLCLLLTRTVNVQLRVSCITTKEMKMRLI